MIRDFIETLNFLYRKFQDSFMETPERGKVGIVARHCLWCKGRGQHQKNVIEIKDISESEYKDELLSMVELLPKDTHVHIICLPDTNDIIEIYW